RLLPRAANGAAADLEPGANHRVGALRGEREAEVRGECRLDARTMRFLDHRDEVPGEQRLAPVVELDLEEIGPELVQQLSVELEAHVRPRATVLADAGEAGGTLEVANVRRFDVELDGSAAESCPSATNLQVH